MVTRTSYSALNKSEQSVYAVTFFVKRRDAAGDDIYDDMARRMAALFASMPGFLNMEHARAEDGFGIMVCYWESEEALARWKAHTEDLESTVAGRGRLI